VEDFLNYHNPMPDAKEFMTATLALKYQFAIIEDLK
jgi:hypothetical protein